MPLTDFRYVPTSGDLPGKSFEEQTERAFNELGIDITNIQDVADNALNIASDAKAAAGAAVQTAQNAEQLAGEAKQTAEQAQTSANVAQSTANNAQASANVAQSTADNALNTSTAAQSAATQAVNLANAAQATADAAVQGVSDNKDQIDALRNALFVLVGVFETYDDAIDFDQYTFPFKIYATSPSSTGLPEDIASEDFPLFIQGAYNSTITACFQEVFSANTPEITYIRTGELSEDPVDGLVVTWGEWKRSMAIAEGDLPPGGIILWSGSADAIPAGWLLCDGDNGTPNLCDRFIVGAGSTYAVGETGGAASGSGSVSINGTTNATTLTLNQIPNHNHELWSTNSPDGSSSSTLKRANVDLSDTTVKTRYVGGNGAHSHGINISATATEVPTVPPFYALCYIMKL